MTHADEVEFRLNGRALEPEAIYATNGVSPVACSTFSLRAPLDPDGVQKGPNRFSACLKKRCEAAAGVPVLTGLQMVVNYTR